MSYYVNPHGHSCPWYPSAELFGAPNIKWCEETLCHWVSEPANTWSNILYLLVAFYIFYSANKTKQKELIWLGPAMFIMGLFSLAFHLSNNYFTQVLDFIGMYLFVFWLLILNLRRLDIVKESNQVKVMTALSIGCTVLVHLMYINFLKFQVIIMFAVAAILYTEYLCYKKEKGLGIKYKVYTIGIVFVALAQLASQLDQHRVLCDPQNHWLQGHAVWHILAAIGLTLAYKFYEQFQFSKPISKVETTEQWEEDEPEEDL